MLVVTGGRGYCHPPLFSVVVKYPVPLSLVNTIQRSDFAYWLVLKLFRSQFVGMIGISPEAYEAFSPEEKRLTHEMLDFMHPMSPRWPGNMHETSYVSLSAGALRNITVPG